MLEVNEVAARDRAIAALLEAAGDGKAALVEKAHSHAMDSRHDSFGSGAQNKSAAINIIREISEKLEEIKRLKV